MILTIKIILILMGTLSLFALIAEKENTKHFNLAIVTITNVAGLVILSVFA